MYQDLTLEQLIQLWNAVMANAYPGDEQEIAEEIRRRGGFHDLY